MAEITTPKGKQAPSIDMTPMVDLGFLLITFFMLASSFMTPKAIKITSPADDPTGTTAPSLKCSKSLTIILDANNTLKYYTCPETNTANNTDFSNKGLRQLLLNRQKEVEEQWGNKDELIVLVKSTPSAKYKQFIDAIDEMHITHTQFVMAPLDKQDSTVLKW